MNQRDIGMLLETELGNAATTHGVAELESKGIRRVRVLNRERLEGAARVAINRTLRTQLSGLDLPDEVRSAIEQRALAEFTQLISDGLAPESNASTRPEDLHTLMAQEQRRVHDLVGGAPTTPLKPSERSDEVVAMESRMARDLGDLLENDWKKELAQVETNHRNQLGILEQRISKLVRALESTDRVLEHMKVQTPSNVNNVDESSPAALDPQSPLFEKKSQLLSALFQANLELKELEDGDVAG